MTTLVSDMIQERGVHTHLFLQPVLHATPNSESWNTWATFRYTSYIAHANAHVNKEKNDSWVTNIKILNDIKEYNKIFILKSHY